MVSDGELKPFQDNNVSYLRWKNKQLRNLLERYLFTRYFENSDPLTGVFKPNFHS